MRAKRIAVATLLGIALAAGIWAAASLLGGTREPETPTTATILTPKAEVPPFSLVDHRGEPVDADLFRGRWDLVFFGFTNCPDICPLTLQVLSSARERLKAAGVEPLPRIVLVSVDPERDTVKRMADYVSNFGEDVIGLTGDPEEIRRLAEGLYVFYQKRDSDSENYLVDHSAVVLVIDPEGRNYALFSSPHKVENFVSDLPLLLEG